MNDVLEKIKFAFLAIGGETWERKHCDCDPSVGMEPCSYCAIHQALRDSKKHIIEIHNQYCFGCDMCGTNSACG